MTAQLLPSHRSPVDRIGQLVHALDLGMLARLTKSPGQLGGEVRSIALYSACLGLYAHARPRALGDMQTLPIGECALLIGMRPPRILRCRRRRSDLG